MFRITVVKLCQQVHDFDQKACVRLIYKWFRGIGKYYEYMQRDIFQFVVTTKNVSQIANVIATTTVLSFCCSLTHYIIPGDIWHDDVIKWKHFPCH